ncbi:hypothetical protein G3M48_002110 [Beauveria asiatica]|uniref:Uncharacterized protein n=1 Tax=Beauveria asiatica TaxID=1069075 RepID=A0AAW0RZ35_9HYPO
MAKRFLHVNKKLASVRNKVTKLSVEFFDGRTETFDALISTGGIFGLFPRTHSKMAFQPTPLRRLGSATAAKGMLMCCYDPAASADADAMRGLMVERWD